VISTPFAPLPIGVEPSPCTPMKVRITVLLRVPRSSMPLPSLPLITVRKVGS
jgi:hypothetical protein